MTTEIRFNGRLGLQQRVLPDYRVPFFEQLGALCEGGFSLFAGQPREREAIKTASQLNIGKLVPAQNRHILGGGFYLCFQPGIIGWLEGWQPDVLIVEANSRYPSTRQAIRWMKSRQRPVLGWGLGAPPPAGVLKGLQQRVRADFLAQLDGVIAYSQRGAQEYQSLGLSADRVFVAHNAAAPRPVSLPPARPETFERGSVLFVGRLQSRKRLEMLFQACAELPEEQQPELVIVGDGPAYAEFKAQAEAIYPETLFAGARHGEELAPYFANADLFVLPGTGGLAVQQAMSSGLPVIVAQGDGTQEDLVRPENGWLIQPGSQQSLNQALADALSDPIRLREMGAESYRITAEEINLQQMAASFVRAVNHVQQALLAN
ncbi:MAG: glycosyltransferase [Anaerolineales bacterium]|nr:glycosyltransferase [Anaerolineales bacterium]